MMAIFIAHISWKTGGSCRIDFLHNTFGSGHRRINTFIGLLEIDSSNGRLTQTRL